MNTNFKVGDRIRSYDFEKMPDRPDRYLVGTITKVNTETGLYEFSADTRVVGSTIEHLKNVVEIHTPIDMCWGDWDGRLTLDTDHDPDYEFDIDAEVERIIEQNNDYYASMETEIDNAGYGL